MKKIKSLLAFTLIELLVVISIIAILASLAIPAITGALVKGQMTQALSNEKQIYLATFSMSTDRISTGDSSIGWPGDLLASGTIKNTSDFVAVLVQNNYLKAGDLKVFAAAGVSPYNGSFNPGANGAIGTFNPEFNTSPTGANNNCAYTIYAVQEADPSNSIFLVTNNAAINVTGSTTCNFNLTASTTPFGNKGFVVFHRGGDGVILNGNQAGKTNLVGAPCLASGTGGGAGTGWLTQ